MKRRTLAEEVHNTPVRGVTPFDAELVSYLQSLPPPPMTEARQRVAARPRTDSDSFDIEQLQRELEERIARHAAERLSEERRTKLEALEALDRERKRRWGDLGWDIIKWAVLGTLAIITGAIWGAIKGKQ